MLTSSLTLISLLIMDYCRPFVHPLGPANVISFAQSSSVPSSLLHQLPFNTNVRAFAIGGRKHESNKSKISSNNDNNNTMTLIDAPLGNGNGSYVSDDDGIGNVNEWYLTVTNRHDYHQYWCSRVIETKDDPPITSSTNNKVIDSAYDSNVNEWPFARCRAIPSISSLLNSRNDDIIYIAEYMVNSTVNTTLPSHIQGNVNVNELWRNAVKMLNQHLISGEYNALRACIDTLSAFSLYSSSSPLISFHDHHKSNNDMIRDNETIEAINHSYRSLVKPKIDTDKAVTMKTILKQIKCTDLNNANETVTTSLSSPSSLSSSMSSSALTSLFHVNTYKRSRASRRTTPAAAGLDRFHNHIQFDSQYLSSSLDEILLMNDGTPPSIQSNVPLLGRKEGSTSTATSSNETIIRQLDDRYHKLFVELTSSSHDHGTRGDNLPVSYFVNGCATSIQKEQPTITNVWQPAETTSSTTRPQRRLIIQAFEMIVSDGNRLTPQPQFGVMIMKHVTKQQSQNGSVGSTVPSIGADGSNGSYNVKVYSIHWMNNKQDTISYFRHLFTQRTCIVLIY
jgi:hypothetical protein